MEENKLTSFRKLRQNCCNFFTNHPKKNVNNDLSNLLQLLLHNDCSTLRQAGYKSFEEEYTIKKKISELLKENINLIVLNEEESLINLKNTKILIEQNNLWTNLHFGREEHHSSFIIDNILKILTEEIYKNKSLINFSFGTKSIKTIDMMNHYISAIINFIPLLPNQIIILFNPIYWSLFIYNFLFSSMIKDTIFNIEIFYEKNIDEKIFFMGLLKENNEEESSIITKLIMMRIDPLKKSIIKKHDISIKESDENIISELNLIIENEFMKEFENFQIDKIIPNDLIISIVGDDIMDIYPTNKQELIDHIIESDKIDKEILKKFIIYIILTSHIDQISKPFPKNFIDRLRQEYREFYRNSKNELGLKDDEIESLIRKHEYINEFVQNSQDKFSSSLSSYSLRKLEEIFDPINPKKDTMPKREVIIFILTNKLKELFDEIHRHWIHHTFDKNNDTIRFFCKNGKSIGQSKFFNILISLCKDRHWTLTNNNVMLTLYHYFEDISFNMNNQNSLIFPENVTVYNVKNKKSLIDIYISKQSFYHTLFDDNFFHHQLYVIEVLSKTNTKYEFFFVKNLDNNQKPIVVLNNGKDLSINNQLYISYNLLSRLIGNHNNLNIVNDLFNIFQNNKDKTSQEIIKNHIKQIFKGDTKINLQHIPIETQIHEINQINIKKIYFPSFNENTQRIILQSTLLYNHFSSQIILSLPSNQQINNPLLNFITVLNDKTKVSFRNKKYDFSEIYQKSEIIHIKEITAIQKVLEPIIEMDIIKEIGLKIKNLELMESKYSVPFNIDQFKDINDLKHYMEITENENIYVAMNTLSNGLVNSKFFRYFIKFQIHMLQFLCFHFNENPNFKGKKCEFKIICRNKNNKKVFETEIHNILSLSQKKKKNINHFYDQTKFANIILSKIDIGEFGIGESTINNIKTNNSTGSRFSRTNSCHFEKFFDIEDMYLLNINTMLPYSPYDFLFLNDVKCKRLQKKTILKPYNLLILHGTKQPKEKKKQQQSKEKKEKKPSCKNVLLSTLNNGYETFIDSNDEITEAYGLIKNEFEDFWENNENILPELKNTFGLTGKGVYSLNKLKETYPILADYLTKLYGNKNGTKPQNDRFTNKNYMATLFFDYLFLEKLISKIEIKIDFGEDTFTKSFSISENNLIIQHADKGNDPFYTEFPFYDIEKQIFNSLFESTREGLKEKVQEKIKERKKKPKEYYFKKDEFLKIIAEHPDSMMALNPYFIQIEDHFGKDNFETHYPSFGDTIDGEILFNMIEDLKYEANRKFNKINHHKEKIDELIKNGEDKQNIKGLKKLTDHVYHRIDLTQFKRNFEDISIHYRGLLIEKITEKYNKTNDKLYNAMLDYINSDRFYNILTSFQTRGKIIMKKEEKMDIEEKGEEKMSVEIKKEIPIIIHYRDLREENEDNEDRVIIYISDSDSEEND